jgi:ADP-heptose:LPS heptosyltransferase
LDVEVGFSFFPQDGIFNQLISTGSFELIKNVELKNILLEMYNHQKQRNYAMSTEIDHFNIRFRNDLLVQFRISFNYNSYDGAFYGSRTVNQYKFNQPYYMSNDFYGLLSQAKFYGNLYTRLLKDIEKSYLTALSLAKNEIVQ